MRPCKRTDAVLGITATANRLDTIIDPGSTSRTSSRPIAPKRLPRSTVSSAVALRNAIKQMWSHLPSAHNVFRGDVSTALIKYLLGMDQL
jgi:hypothetical protein